MKSKGKGTSEYLPPLPNRRVVPGGPTPGARRRDEERQRDLRDMMRVQDNPRYENLRATTPRRGR